MVSVASFKVIPIDCPRRTTLLSAGCFLVVFMVAFSLTSIWRRYDDLWGGVVRAESTGKSIGVRPTRRLRWEHRGYFGLSICL